MVGSGKDPSTTQRDKIAPGIVTLGDVEQAEIAMEAGRVKAVLAGGEAGPTETPGEPEAP